MPGQWLLAGGLVASDGQVRKPMRFAFDRFKTVIEPGATVGIAAVLNRQVDMTGRTAAVFTTGGNVAPDRYCELLNGAG